MKTIKNSYRQDIIKLIEGDNLVGIELGVAGGEFSKRMVESGRFSQFYGVDMYADMHDTDEYKMALKHVGIDKNYKLFRMTFEEALDLFEDNSLDFIYVDGYAHSGEEGGRTIIDWSKKVKIGGLIAGDDYHKDWPLVVQAVDSFVESINGDLYVTENVEKGPTSEFPSWGVIKRQQCNLEYDQTLVEKGISENKKHEMQYLKQIVKKKLMPSFLKKRR
ncbi:hypothetical protein NM09_18505 [Vibrio caribbeanicus]|uniref:Uncharacterized protein n=1 Tax=Vibrio caribbeanicus TaxID=701175 RepID=A0ACC4NSE4_9VIBR|nr:class I SAM-dependent methyltransferase [Vibrio caribbeanicus]KHD23462.1 hypothetical protein NM09_18505 [Vibrio caribbeanicus]